MSVTPERAKLGTTRLIPTIALVHQDSTVTTVRHTLGGLAAELETAAGDDRVVLWNTLRVEGRLDVNAGSLAFTASVQTIHRGDRSRGEVLAELVAATNRESDRRRNLTALEAVAAGL